MINPASAVSAALLAALLAVGAHLPPPPAPDTTTVKEVIDVMETPTYAAATAELSLRLLRLTADDPTRMVSALSLSEALTLLAEGASGQTLEELEGTIGMSIEDLRDALPAYLESLPSTEKAAFRSANSVWAEENGFVLDESYAQRIRDRYAAEIVPISFAAPGAAARINGWVSDATDGMIPKLVDDDSVRSLTLLLVNALCFDAKWERPFDATTVPGDFYCADDTAKKVDYMISKSDRQLIDSDGTLGFVKPYVGGSYSFVALLPPEGTSLDDYLAEMSGEDFVALVKSAEACDQLRIRMPRFKLDYSIKLNETLQALGVNRIFSPADAELNGLGKAGGNLYVDTVLQKTHIDVDTEGTRAAAVTAIMVKATSARPPMEYREVNLDRPFVYAIIDNATATPLFIGTIAELGK